MAEKMTGEQLRADIDAGRTGDKIAFPDPAAAPLGTDAEAGGATTLFPSERRGNSTGSGRNWSGLIAYMGMIIAIGLCAVAIVWMGT